MPRGDASTRLDPDKILNAALAVADRHGLSGMTLRMVGTELGADPTAIYRHFASKDALVAAMADRLFVEVVDADYPDEWRPRFIALIRAVRDLYRAHPTIVDALANLPEESPGLVAINELSAGCLAEAGVDPRHIGLFHQFVAAYMIGNGMLEGSWAQADGSREASRRVYLALDPKQFPNCAAVADSMFPEGDDVLDFAIEILLDAIVRVADHSAGAATIHSQHNTKTKEEAMTRRTLRLTALLIAGAAVASACSGKDDESDASSASATESATAESTATAEATATAPAGGDGEAITWATYREVNSLDPIYAFDYPENTVVYSMCESLLEQQPDGTISPGITTLTRPDDLTMVFTVTDGVTFWDGTPLTADDIVFSLERQMNPELAGFYPTVFANVASITATAPNEVTIALTAPDYFLEGELASTPGLITQKAFTEAAGAAFGTPDGGTMCTGPFQYDSWAVGDKMSVTAFDGYWNGAPQIAGIDFVGVPDENTLTSGLLSGDIDGYYGTLGTLDTLKADPAVTVTSGPSYASSALILSNPEGTLADVTVRQALSMAIDRQGIIDAVFKGEADLPRAVPNPGTWGYGTDVFEAAWAVLPDVTQDIEAAKAMVEEAGATGQPIVIGMSNEIASIATMANAIAAAAEAIGLTVELKPVSAANYINFFIDPTAREGIDGFLTVNYPDYADPAALLTTYGTPTGSQNYNAYDNPDVTALFDEARTTADPAARADLVAQAQAILQDELPWIGIANPNTTLTTSAGITGAPAAFTYMFSPWPAKITATN